MHPNPVHAVVLYMIKDATMAAMAMAPRADMPKEAEPLTPVPPGAAPDSVLLPVGTTTLVVAVVVAVLVEKAVISSRGRLAGPSQCQ
jgi:hypothetical protein